MTEAEQKLLTIVTRSLDEIEKLRRLTETMQKDIEFLKGQKNGNNKRF